MPMSRKSMGAGQEDQKPACSPPEHSIDLAVFFVASLMFFMCVAPQQAAAEEVLRGLSHVENSRPAAGTPASALSGDSASTGQKGVRTIEDAAAIIMAALGSDNVYVYPPSVNNAAEITPFGASLQEQIQVKLGARAKKEPSADTNSLVGQYETRPGSLLVNYQLLDSQGAEKGRVELVLQNGTNSLPRVMPNDAIDAAFFGPLQQDGTLRSELTTSFGNKNILLRGGQRYRLIARLNQPGYVYVVGHVVRANEKFSYMLELADNGPGDDLFVRYIGPNEINRSIQLGEFETAAPFGLEYLNLFAETKDPRGRLPPYTKDRKADYYVLNDSKLSLADAIQTTRAGKRVKESARTESRLVLTTMPGPADK